MNGQTRAGFHANLPFASVISSHGELLSQLTAISITHKDGLRMVSKLQRNTLEVSEAFGDMGAVDVGKKVHDCSHIASCAGTPDKRI